MTPDDILALFRADPVLAYDVLARAPRELPLMAGPWTLAGDQWVRTPLGGVAQGGVYVSATPREFGGQRGYAFGRPGERMPMGLLDTIELAFQFANGVASENGKRILAGPVMPVRTPAGQPVVAQPVGAQPVAPTAPVAVPQQAPRVITMDDAPACQPDAIFMPVHVVRR